LGRAAAEADAIREQ